MKGEGIIVSTAPQNFDWIAARAKCSLLKVFNELRLGTEEDVKAVNLTSRPSEYPPPSFEVRSNFAADCFVVFQQENSNARVEFNCHADHFTVRKRDAEFSVTLTLTNEGRCKLRVGDSLEELEMWQVRRMMLEDLFFKNWT